MCLNIEHVQFIVIYAWTAAVLFTVNPSSLMFSLFSCNVRQCMIWPHFLSSKDWVGVIFFFSALPSRCVSSKFLARVRAYVNFSCSPSQGMNKLRGSQPEVNPLVNEVIDHGNRPLPFGSSPKNHWWNFDAPIRKTKPISPFVREKQKNDNISIQLPIFFFKSQKALFFGSTFHNFGTLLNALSF